MITRFRIGKHQEGCGGFKAIETSHNQLGNLATWYPKEFLPSTVTKKNNNNSMEYLFIEIYAADSKFLIGTVYRPRKTVDISIVIDFYKIKVCNATIL